MNEFLPMPPFDESMNLLTLEPAPAFSLQLRQARKRNYFAIHSGMEINSLPYKYNLRIEGLILPNDTVRLELVCGHTQVVHHGIQVERTVCRQDYAHVELRIGFLVQSYNYSNSQFCIRVYVGDSMALCSESFELVARRHRKRTPKK